MHTFLYLNTQTYYEKQTLNWIWHLFLDLFRWIWWQSDKKFLGHFPKTACWIGPVCCHINGASLHTVPGTFHMCSVWGSCLISGQSGEKKGALAATSTIRRLGGKKLHLLVKRGVSISEDVYLAILHVNQVMYLSTGVMTGWQCLKKKRLFIFDGPKSKHTYFGINRQSTYWAPLISIFKAA